MKKKYNTKMGRHKTYGSLKQAAHLFFCPDLKAKAGNIVTSRKIKTMFDMRQFLNIPENVFLTVTLAEVCSLFLSPTHFLHQRIQCFTSFKYFK